MVAFLQPDPVDTAGAGSISPMSTVASVLAAFDGMAPLSRAAAWDSVGLQVGDAEATVGSAAVCHDVTEAVVAELERRPADLLVSYHPLLFRPQSSFVAGPTPSGRAFRLGRAGVAVAAVHTAFDVAPGGSGDALAGALGLEDVQRFGPVPAADATKFVVFVPASEADRVAAAMSEAGAGVIGNYTQCSFRGDGVGTFIPGAGAEPTVGRPGRLNREPEVRLEMVAPARLRDAVIEAVVAVHPYEEPAFDIYDVQSNTGLFGRSGHCPGTPALAEFAARVGVALGTAVRYAGESNRPVAVAAVAPGSGASLIEAAAGRADVLVTGDVSHHRARDALDRGLAVVDAGHVPTERPGLGALYAAVSEIVPETRDLARLDSHPWREL